MTIENKMIKELCEKYIKAFEKKDLDTLSKMFSKNILLRDWNVSILGRDNVLKENTNIFKNADYLKVTILETFESNNTGICEIKIEINKDTIFVTDIIGFNKDNKIEFIRAYKG